MVIGATGVTIPYATSGRIHALTSDIGPISNTETIIVGGASSPLIRSSALYRGRAFYITMAGNATVTGTTGRAPTFHIRMGATGTISDALVLETIFAQHSANGTNVPFYVSILLRSRTTSSTNAQMSGTCTLVNQGATGISNIQTQVDNMTVTSYVSTIDNYMSVCFLTTGTQMSAIFTNATIEML